MIATLSAVTRERLRRFMRIVRMAAVIGAGVGAVYGGAIAGPGARSLLVSLLISIPIGVIAALLTASLIAGIEIFLLPRASMRWLDALPFAAVLILKTLVYGAIAGAVFADQPGQRLFGVVTVYTARTGLIAVCLSLVAVAVLVMMFQAAGLVGYRTFMALLLGKYRLTRRPHEKGPDSAVARRTLRRGLRGTTCAPPRDGRRLRVLLHCLAGFQCLQSPWPSEHRHERLTSQGPVQVRAA
jgi:hypothetical protein